VHKLTTVLVTAVAGVVVLQPNLAHADSYVRTDAAKDVVMIDENGNEVKDPTRTDGDIVTSAASHNRRKFAVAMTFSDLGNDSAVSGYLFAFRTNEHKARFLQITAIPGQGWRGTLSSRHGQVRCKGLYKKVDYADRRVQAIIPRRCLSNPRWVQVSMATLSVKNESDESAYADDALLNGKFAGSSWGPRVHRG
jgi:hypothetical protein